MGPQNNGKHKDRWDKAAIIFQLIGPLVVGGLLAFVGWRVNSGFEILRQSEELYRLHSEIINQREQADSVLRKDLFKPIIESFVAGKKESLDQQVLDLELLGRNFHETLDLGPLFDHILGRIKREKGVCDLQRQKEKELKDRIQALATRIRRRQLIILDQETNSARLTVDLGDVKCKEDNICKPLVIKADGESQNEYIDLWFRENELEGNKMAKRRKRFRVSVLAKDYENQELWMRLEAISVKEVPSANPCTKCTEVLVDHATFHLGFYDFPIIDHSRYSDDTRCALVLEELNDKDHFARIRMVFFPGYRSTIKDRPYIHDVIRRVRSRPAE